MLIRGREGRVKQLAIAPSMILVWGCARVGSLILEAEVSSKTQTTLAAAAARSCPHRELVHENEQRIGFEPDYIFLSDQALRLAARVFDIAFVSVIIH